MIVLIAFLIGAIMGLVTGVNDAKIGFSSGLRIGVIVAIIACLLLSFLILKNKNRLSDPLSLVLFVLAGILAIFGGALLGLIPVAYLSTRK
ncbi:hypothetical protein M1437_00060 [Patescibacteria group bacterium]|nr:hypothetical protein [Patescibacteria group bacterium]